MFLIIFGRLFGAALFYDGSCLNENHGRRQPAEKKFEVLFFPLETHVKTNEFRKIGNFRGGGWRLSELNQKEIEELEGHIPVTFE